MSLPTLQQIMDGTILSIFILVQRVAEETFTFTLNDVWRLRQTCRRFKDVVFSGHRGRFYIDAPGDYPQLVGEAYIDPQRLMKLRSQRVLGGVANHRLRYYLPHIYKATINGVVDVLIDMPVVEDVDFYETPVSRIPDLFPGIDNRGLGTIRFFNCDPLIVGPVDMAGVHRAISKIGNDRQSECLLEFQRRLALATQITTLSPRRLDCSPTSFLYSTSEVLDLHRIKKDAMVAIDCEALFLGNVGSGVVVLSLNPQRLRYLYCFGYYSTDEDLRWYNTLTSFVNVTHLWWGVHPIPTCFPQLKHLHTTAGTISLPLDLLVIDYSRKTVDTRIEADVRVLYHRGDKLIIGARVEHLVVDDDVEIDITANGSVGQRHSVGDSDVPIREEELHQHLDEEFWMGMGGYYIWDWVTD